MNWSHLSVPFFLCAMISLGTGGFFALSAGEVYSASFRRDQLVSRLRQEDDAVGEVALIGPIHAAYPGQVFAFRFDADLDENTWAHVEGELLDEQRRPLVSFTRDLWYETGVEEGEYWRESDSTLKLKLTMPRSGAYYLSVGVEQFTCAEPGEPSDSWGGFDATVRGMPHTLWVSVSAHEGSALPHLYLGLLCLAVGIGLNEMQNKTILGLLVGILKS